MKDLAEHLIGKPKLAYQGKIIKVYQEKVKTPKGEQVQRDIVHHAPDAVALVINNQNRMVLEKQWREPVKAVTIETPAGKVDSRDHKDPRHAMLRELNEEVRIKPDHLKHISGGYISTGITDEYMDFYIATGLHKVQKKLPRDKGEYINLFSVSLQQALGMVEIGQIKDVKTLLAISYWHTQVLARHYQHSRYDNLLIPIVLLHKAIGSLQSSYQGIVKAAITNHEKGNRLFLHICAYPVITSNAFDNLKLFHIVPQQYINQSCQFINNFIKPQNTLKWYQSKKAQKTKTRLLLTLRQYLKHYIKLTKPFRMN